MKRNILLFGVLSVFLFWVLLSGTGICETSPDEILRKSMSVNKNLETFKANLKLSVLMGGMKVPLKGDLYFKTPGKFRLIMAYVPAGLKSRRGFFRDMVPRSFNPEDYRSRLVEREKLDGKIECFVLELLPKNESTIKRACLWIDTRRFVSPKSIIYYKSGGIITTIVNYRSESGYILPGSQFVEFDFPSFLTRVKIDYKAYSINCPIEDGFFSGESS